MSRDEVGSYHCNSLPIGYHHHHLSPHHKNDDYSAKCEVYGLDNRELHQVLHHIHTHNSK